METSNCIKKWPAEKCSCNFHFTCRSAPLIHQVSDWNRFCLECWILCVSVEVRSTPFTLWLFSKPMWNFFSPFYFMQMFEVHWQTLTGDVTYNGIRLLGVTLYKKYCFQLFWMLRVESWPILDLNGNGIYGFAVDEFYCKVYFYLCLFLRTGFGLCSLSEK